MFSLLELVEEHQVEIETIKADYEEQQSEMKVGECFPGTYFYFSEFFFCVENFFLLDMDLHFTRWVPI